VDKKTLEQNASRNLQDKLKSLLLGVEESKAKRIKIEETVVQDY